MLQETYTLANGTKLPKLGLGTWFIDDDKAAHAVRDAVALGYRLIDTAQAYGNERGARRTVRGQQGGRGAEDLRTRRSLHRRNAAKDGA